MHPFKNRLFNLVLAIGLTQTACVTPEESKKATTATNKKHTGVAVKKSGNKVAPPPITAVAAIATDGNPAATSEFVLRNLNPNAVLSSEDLQYWSNLPSPAAPGSLHEAALVIGAVKVTGALSANASFKEADLQSNTTDTSDAPSANKSLDQLCKERSIPIVDALRSNPVLASSGVFTMVQQAIQRSTNPETLTQPIAQIIKSQNEAWRRLSGSNEETSSTASASTEPDAAKVEGSPQSPVAGSSASATDLRNSDNILMEAQILADQKLYQAALAKVNQVNRDSPLYAEAQERVKSFSNGAVQELRQKAALAYQNSIPMSDKSAKENLLKQAKLHLEEAINGYPNSEQIGTVKENLQTIDRELDQLKY